MSNKPRFNWTSAARTDTGRVRRNNEDAFLERPRLGIWAVADGMGGHALGELASRMIVEALDRLPSPDGDQGLTAAARECLQQVNRRLRAEADQRGLQVIGSTVVALVAEGCGASYLWAGDSRIYLYRRRSLVQLTRDHSQIEELRASGADPALLQQARNLITRAVGAWEDIDIDGGSIDVEQGDVFLLCSDGLSNDVSEEDICLALEAPHCDQAANALVDLALAAGGHDNITVVVARADGHEDR